MPERNRFEYKTPFEVATATFDQVRKVDQKHTTKEDWEMRDHQLARHLHTVITDSSPEQYDEVKMDFKGRAEFYHSDGYPEEAETYLQALNEIIYKVFVPLQMYRISHTKAA
jgi:hypothetical protein